VSAAFDVLLAAYRGRDDGWHAARTAGQKVVGVVGNTVPLEAITAAGALAWRVAPVAGSTAAADAEIEAFSDLDMRLIFARYVSGALDGLDLLVVPRSTETQHKLYLALREACRTGLKADGPPLHLFDILHTQRASSHAYGLARLQDLLARLGALTGQWPSAADLLRATVQANTTRALLANLQARRLEGQVSGWQAQVATGALQFMVPAVGQRALADWLSGPIVAPAPGPRLLVSGAPLDHDRLHALVEALGAQIVAEDDDWGSRAATPLVGTALPPAQALFDHCWRDRPCPRIHPANGAWFTQALQAGVDGVLFNHPRPDDTCGWSFPAQRAQVQATGLPFLQLRDDARSHVEALRATLSPFIAGLCR
jgi:hypothetical protein